MSRERLEVSIFKDLDPNKTLISSVMYRGVENGVGRMMVDLLPVLEREAGDFMYRGRVRIGPPSKHPFFNTNIMATEGVDGYNTRLSEDEKVVLTDCKFFLFGGSAYQLHKENDNSKFSHILPGLHDVDLNCFLRSFCQDKGFEHPLSRPSIDRLRKSSNGALDQSDDVLSFILNKMVTTIRDHIVRVSSQHDFVTSYDLTVDETTSQVVLITPDESIEDSTCMYSELVADYFRIKIVDEVSLMKIQVEVRPMDSRNRATFTDHAFEMILSLGDAPLNHQPFEKILGVNVETKDVLFQNTISALIDRSVNAIQMEEGSACSRNLQGKCSQDFLRIVYVLLEELDKEGGGFATKEMSTIAFKPGRGVPILAKMFETLGPRSTPIKIFIFVSKFVGLCVKATTLTHSDIPVSVSKETFTEFDRIISMFRNAFEDNGAFLTNIEVISTMEEINKKMMGDR